MKFKSKIYIVSKCPAGHLLFLCSAIFLCCSHRSFAHSFSSLALGGHSVLVQHNRYEPTRAALRRLVPCPLIEPYRLCIHDLKPTTSERLIKNDYEPERRLRQHHRMAEFLFPTQAQDLSKTILIFRRDDFYVKGISC